MLLEKWQLTTVVRKLAVITFAIRTVVIRRLLLESLLEKLLEKLLLEQLLLEQLLSEQLLLGQWKGINHKQSARWQPISRLKANTKKANIIKNKPS